MATIKVGNLKNTSTWKNTKAPLSIMIESPAGIIIIKECRLVEGQNGLFVAGPSKKYEDSEGMTKYFQYIDIDENAQQQIIEDAQRAFDHTQKDYRMYNLLPTTKNGDDEIPF